MSIKTKLKTAIEDASYYAKMSREYRDSVMRTISKMNEDVKPILNEIEERSKKYGIQVEIRPSFAAGCLVECWEPLFYIGSLTYISTGEEVYNLSQTEISDEVAGYLEEIAKEVKDVTGLDCTVIKFDPEMASIRNSLDGE